MGSSFGASASSHGLCVAFVVFSGLPNPQSMPSAEEKLDFVSLCVSALLCSRSFVSMCGCVSFAMSVISLYCQKVAPESRKTRPRRQFVCVCFLCCGVLIHLG